MAHHDALVDRFSSRLAAWCIIRQSVAAVTLWSFLWGTAVLILRAATSIPTPWLLFGVIGIPLAVAFAIRIAISKLPDSTTLRAFLDKTAGCGGLLMAGDDHDLRGWKMAMPRIEQPRFIWKARRPLILLAIATGFVILVFVIPIRHALYTADAQLDVARQTDRLDAQIRVLKEEKILEPERAQSLQEKLGQIRAESAAKDPAKTLEAIDYLHDIVSQAAKKSAEGMAREAKELAKVEASAEALDKAADSLNDKANTALMKELSAMAEKAASEGEALKENLDPELGAAVAEGKLTRNQLEKLSEAAEEAKKTIEKRGKRLNDSKLIDSDQLKQITGDNKSDTKQLADFLKKTKGEKSLKQGMDQDGNGGTEKSDEEGDTDITFGDKSTQEGVKFHEEALPPADLELLKESIVLGLGATTPKPDPKAAPPSTGALQGSMAGGGSANAAPVLPQHRGAVDRYFDRTPKK